MGRKNSRAGLATTPAEAITPKSSQLCLDLLQERSCLLRLTESNNFNLPYSPGKPRAEAASFDADPTHHHLGQRREKAVLETED